MFYLLWWLGSLRRMFLAAVLRELLDEAEP